MPWVLAALAALFVLAVGLEGPARDRVGNAKASSVNGPRPDAGATVVALAIGLLPVNGALGAGNAVPGSKVTRYQDAITANTLKPVDCAGITLTTVVAGNTGTSGADLLLGSAAANSMSCGRWQRLRSRRRRKRLDQLRGGHRCRHRGPGTDTFNANCETRIQ